GRARHRRSGRARPRQLRLRPRLPRRRSGLRGHDEVRPCRLWLPRRRAGGRLRRYGGRGHRLCGDARLCLRAADRPRCHPDRPAARRDEAAVAVLNPLRWWRALLALPNESRTKTLAVALLVALVSAAAVSVTSVALKPLQQASLDRQRE